MIGRKMVPQRLLHPNPLHVILDYMQDGNSIGARLKVACQLILRWKVDPRISEWPQCNQKST